MNVAFIELEGDMGVFATGSWLGLGGSPSSWAFPKAYHLLLVGALMHVSRAPACLHVTRLINVLWRCISSSMAWPPFLFTLVSQDAAPGPRQETMEAQEARLVSQS